MNMKRMRGRNHRPNSGGGGFRNQQNGIPLNRNHVFDSTGPEMRVRGTAQQLYDKYQQLARDAFSNGDRVTGEAYYQHAEHYFRIISAINQAQGQPNGQQNGQPYQNNGQDRGNYQGNGQDRGNYNDRDFNRREPNYGDVSTEPPAQEPRPEPRFQEPRPQEPRRFERHDRNNEHRPNKPEFQRPERQDRPERAERYRPPEPPAIDPRIDISSALEAELAATVAEPAQLDFAGFGDQPVIQPPIEARSIPIIPDAPPQPAPDPTTEPPARTPRPRGRPRTVKPEAEKSGTGE
jgi:hypothetical protein